MGLMCIYKLTAPNGKIYIGFTTNYDKRMATYSRVKTYYNKQARLYASINKHGYKNFKREVVEIIENECELDPRERYWIAHFKCNYRRYPEVGGLNLTDGGKGSKGYKWSEYQKKSVKDKNLPNSYAKTMINMETGVFFESVKEAAHAHNIKTQKLTKWNLGKHPHKKPIFSIDNVEHYNPIWLESQKHKREVAVEKAKPKPRKTWKLSEAHKAILVKALTGRVVSDESRLKSRFSHKGSIVLDMNTGVYFQSVPEAAECYNINLGTLRDQLTGRTKKRTTNLEIV